MTFLGILGVFILMSILFGKKGFLRMGLLLVVLVGLTAASYPGSGELPAVLWQKLGMFLTIGSILIFLHFVKSYFNSPAWDGLAEVVSLWKLDKNWTPVRQEWTKSGL